MSGHRNFGSPETRRVVALAIAQGWIWRGTDSRGHGVIVWPATGQRVTISSSPGVASWKTVATKIRDISGADVWRKGNRKRSRKPAQGSGFDMAAAVAESAEWGARVDELQRRRGELIANARLCACSRTTMQAIPGLLHKISRVEMELRDRYYQHVEPFDPRTLAIKETRP